jgi:polar amino acid transport system substrate-binding protein
MVLVVTVGRARRYLLGSVAAWAMLLAVAPIGTADPAPQPVTDPGPAPVTVAVHDLDPFVMRTGSGELTGFSIDLWNEIAKRLRWETEFVDVDDVGAQLAAVGDGRADIAIGAISLTSQREQSFDFSQPTLDAGLQIIVPVEDTRPSVPGLGGYLELLLARTMLIWLGAALVVSVVPAPTVAPRPTVTGATSCVSEPMKASSSMIVRCLLAPS